jgi:hypothetical protein
MPAKKVTSRRTTHVPKMSDSAVKAKTGKDWRGWFGALDKAGAKKLTHKEIVEVLHAKHGVPGWWSQMLTVEYELARGLRERHQKSDGYSVSATKTIAASVSKVYEATIDARQRKRWFPRGVFTPSSQTKDKYVNGAWRRARLNFGFYARSGGKAQIAVQVNKLADKEAVEQERQVWKAALAKLQSMLET